MHTIPPEKLLETTLRAIGDGVISCNREGQIVLLNAEAEHLTGWSEDEAVGKPLKEVFQIIHETTRNEVEDPVAKVYRLGGVVGLANHTLLIRKDLTEIAIDDSAAPIIDDQGDLRGVVLIFRDVTERRRAEYNLEFLAASGRILGEAKDVMSILERIGGLATKHFADVAVFDIIQPDGRIQRIVGPHRVPEQSASVQGLQKFVARSVDNSYTARMTASNQGSVLVPVLSDSILQAAAHSPEHLIFLRDVLQAKSMIISPIMADNEKLGTTTFLRTAIALPFDQQDLSAADELSTRLGLALRYTHTLEELAMQRARLDAIFRSAPIGIMVADANGRILSGNDELDRVLGHPLMQGNGVEEYKDRLAMFPDGRRLQPEEYPMARAIQHGETIRNEELLYGQSDGKKRWISVSGAPVRDLRGNLLGGVIAVSNIDEQKQAREFLVRSEERFRLLIERASVGINIGDETGRLTYVNPTLLKLIGYTEEEVKRGDVRWDELTPERYAQADKNALHELATKGLAQPYEKAYRAKDGHLVPMLLGAVMIPSLTKSGSSEDIAVFFTDLTVQKQAEVALLQSEKLAAVGKLASSISHEINNPLEAVTNLLFLTRSDTSLSQQTREYLETAERELARVSQVTSQTLRFHRQSTSAQRVRPESLIEEVLNLYSTRFTNSNIQIARDYQPGVQITCYEGEIRQVLNNLIGNAFDAMRTGGRLTIKTRYATRWSCGQKGKDTSPDAFMFPGRFGGPMDSSNFRHRVLHTLAEELDLPKLTFQVIRRTIATLGKTKGHVKDIQGMMRHSKASTTTDVYMQSLEPEVRSAINAIHDELMGNGTTGPAPHASAGSPAATRVEEHLSAPRQAEATKEVLLEGGKKPVRGVVLEFATRMRQSRGREVLLND